MNNQQHNTEELLQQSTQRRVPLSRDQKDAIFARVRQATAEESVQEEREERFSKWLIGIFASVFIGAAGSAAAAFFVAYQLVTTATPATEGTQQVAVEEVQDIQEEVVTEEIAEEVQEDETVPEETQEETGEEIIDIPVPERQKTTTYVVATGGGFPNRVDTQWDVVYQPQIDIAETSVSVQEFTAMTEQRMNEIIDIFTDTETFVRQGNLRDYMTTLTKQQENTYGQSCINAMNAGLEIDVCAQVEENGELSVEWSDDSGIPDGVSAASSFINQLTGSTVASALMPSENTYTEGDSRFGLELYALTPAAYTYNGVEYQPVPWVAAVLNGRLVGLKGQAIPVSASETVQTISGEEALARFAANMNGEGYGYIYEIENEAELVGLESVELQVLGVNLEYEYFYTDSAEYLVPVYVVSGVERNSGVEFHAIVNALSPPDSLGNITANF